MREWEERAMEKKESYAKGLTEGLAEGIPKGENRMAQLCDFLMKQDRLEDMQKAIENLEYREVLYAEFNL